MGAGTAGSLVASELSNTNPLWSILLVEAGDGPDIHSEVSYPSELETSSRNAARDLRVSKDNETYLL